MFGRNMLRYSFRIIIVGAILCILFGTVFLYFNSNPDSSSRSIQSIEEIIMKGKYIPEKLFVKPLITTEHPAVSEPEVLRWDGHNWIVWPKFCSDNDVTNYDLADLHAPSGKMPFYVHDSKHDSYTSRIILRTHTYEKDDLELMYRYLLKDEEMGLVDVGAHVGLYSATAALLGRKVLTVDALYMNNHAWCHSITKNNFSKQVKQVYTIMSSSHQLMYFKTIKIHVGGTTVHVAQNQSMQVSPLDKDFIHSATLDDLLPHITFKTAFFKIDVEKHEYQVILGGERFFKELNVKYVLMEWIHHANSPEGDKIRERMTQYGFRGYTAGRVQKEADFTKKMYNVFWIKME